METTMQDKSLGRTFIDYVSQSVLGTLGYSCYILVDTYFISLSAGTAGITVLNLSIPLYDFLFAIGSMIGVGSSIRFALSKGMQKEKEDIFFSNAFFFLLFVGIFCAIFGLSKPDLLLRLMGGRGEIMRIGIPYVRTFWIFSPFFLLNFLITAFVRIDGDPTLAMVATLTSSLFNCVFDYIFIFPMKFGLFGAALATGISPIVSISVCMIHFFRKKNHIRLHWRVPSPRLLLMSAQVGIPAFIAQFSGGVITTVCNLLLLKLSGNTCVAAYGIVTNLAIVASAIFDGIQNGMQPITSDLKGKGREKDAVSVFHMGLLLAFVVAVLIYIMTFLGADFFIGIFNNETNPTIAAELARIARPSLRLYFTGYFFASLNIIVAGYLASIGDGKAGGFLSIARGCVLVVVFAFLLAAIFKVAGVFASFPAAELATLVMILIYAAIKKRQKAELN